MVVTAAKFVFAGVVVMLFGGFLLAGFMSQPDSEHVPVVGASASATPHTSPTAEASHTIDTSREADSEQVLENTTRSDLLPDVDLNVEESEPGVSRVLSDGIRDLPAPATRTASQIVVTPDGDVWVFRPDGFFRLGATATHSGPPLYLADIDATGNVWALVSTNAGKTYGCPNGWLPHLVMYDGKKWRARLCDVAGFQLHPDGSPWVARAADARSHSLVLRRVRDGEWNKARKGASLEWGATGMGQFQAFAMLPAIATGPATAEAGWDVGWIVDDEGRLSDIALSGRTEGHLMDQGWRPELGDEVLALGFGSDRSSWVYVEIDEPVLADGELATDPQQFLVQFSPMGDNPGGARVDQIGAYESRLASPLRQPRQTGSMAPRLDVAPDGAVWLPTDDGLARFDGDAWDWHLRGRVIEDIDIAVDGTVWVQASDLPFDREPAREHQMGITSTYVITPEAVARTE